MKKWVRKLLLMLLVVVSLQLAGCSGNVGVGLSVGVPVGSNGHMRVSTGHWF